MAEPRVLCLSGLDPAGSAGLLRDVWAVQRAGGRALAIATCTTAQTRQRCIAITPTPVEVLREQLDLVLTDEAPNAIKVGLVPDAATWNAIVDALAERDAVPIVVDPVRAPSSGECSVAEDVRDALLDRVCGLAPMLTPNALELAWLGGDDQAGAVAELLRRGAAAVLVKGGHASHESDAVTDVLYQAHAVHGFERPRLGGARRGTGCALASFLAVQLADGIEPRTAARVAGNMLWRSWDRLVPARERR